MKKTTIKTIIHKTLHAALDNIEAIYLFGSHAKGSQSEKSDIDIALLNNEDIGDARLYEIKTDLELALNCDVDLVALSQSNTVHRFQIVAYGELIYKNADFDQDDYENRIWQNYYDLLDDIKPMLENIQKTGKVYG